MARFLSLVLFAFAGTLSLDTDVSSQDRWQAAETAIKRLSPSAFPQLPGVIQRELQARGCAIPQVWLNPRPHNVISGKFVRATQRDWAVLCSRNGASSVLVFWGGSVASTSEIGKADDRTFLQEIDGNGKIGFSRSIRAVGRDYLLGSCTWADKPRPPQVDHQGIEDMFIEKASSVHYRYRGQWFTLQGAD